MSDLQRGDLFIAYPEERLASRHLVNVTRVAKDGSWADTFVSNWACGWAKRQPLKDGDLPYPHIPLPDDLSPANWYVDQQSDWEDAQDEARTTR